MPTRPPQHRPTWWKPYKEDAKQVKRRHARRALATNSTAWRKLRAVHLAGEPLCRSCAQGGRVTAATDVDHIDGDDSNNASSNLQSLCHACHSSKTAKENGGFGRAAAQDDPFDGLLLDPGREPERDGAKLNGNPDLNGRGRN
ncbi:HNH endonuclease signature motif containing protein [Xanthomonas perforans]|uniref:HNH endonuclease signature motif containing protein n=1 Tax=Xanthomonas perforans TaxID=442694 RepID=UPI000D694642|nr:HNH endonuclease signature motif containing protein [Xanthomonas perforans]PWH21638.1 HNH endonuclease [Xanthomonas perforans]